MELGNRIRKARGEKSARELAKEINISPSFLSDIELDKTAPSIDTLQRLAKALGISIAYLMGETDTSIPFDKKPPQKQGMQYVNLKKGEEIKHLRKQKGWTQQELADRVGVTKTTILDWEKDRYSPVGKNLISLAKTLGISAAYFMGETNDPTPPDSSIFQNSGKASAGERLRRMREKMNLSQHELGEKTDISQAYISQLEKGTRNGNKKQWIALGHALNTSGAYLMGETDDPTPLKERKEHKESTKDNNAKDSDEKIPFESNVSGLLNDLICLPVLSMEQTACCGGGIIELEITSSPNETIWVPLSLVGTYDPDHPPYAMHTDGESMENMGIPNESIVVINPVEEVRSFDISLVCYHGRLAIKKVIFKPDGFEIMADNKEKTFIPKKDMDEGVFEIRGKVMQVVSRPKHGF